MMTWEFITMFLFIFIISHWLEEFILFILFYSSLLISVSHNIWAIMRGQINCDIYIFTDLIELEDSFLTLQTAAFHKIVIVVI